MLESQGTLTRLWAQRGSRPPAPRDCRYSWAYIFGAVCPARGTGAALVLPYANAEAMNLHLAEISTCVTLEHVPKSCSTFSVDISNIFLITRRFLFDRDST